MPVEDDSHVAQVRGLIDPSLLASNSKFVVKLTFAERCAIYGLWHLGSERRRLAACFNVNRSTLNFIVKPSSPHYKNVRKEFKDLGAKAFIDTYVTSEVIDRFNSYRDAPEIKLSDAELKEQHLHEKGQPNKQANRLSGPFSMVAPMLWDGVRTFNVLWSDEPGPNPVDGTLRTPGWYVLSVADNRLYGSSDDAKTSKSAREAIVASVGGEVQ